MDFNSPTSVVIRNSDIDTLLRGDYQKPPFKEMSYLYKAFISPQSGMILQRIYGKFLTTSNAAACFQRK